MSTLRVAGGRVLRPDATAERADVLVDRSNGEIQAITEPGETPPTEAVEDRLDATGGLVVPGLINAHTHVAMTLFRGAADDKPLEAWLEEDIWPVEAALTAEDVRAGARLGIAEMIRSGTTAFADMYFEMPAVAEAVADAGLRARLGHGCLSVGKDETAARNDFEESLAFATEYDGAADGRITTMVAPHSLTTVGEQFFREYVSRAHEAGLPTHFHANETTDEVDPIVSEHGTRPLLYADELARLENTHVAHAVHVDDREIELLADRGVAVAHCPAANMKLASGLAPVERMRQAGVSVALGTDGAGSNNDLDMFGEMRDAAMVGKIAADDAAAVPALAVVEMATVGGATALGIDSGRIEPGANADLAVVDLEQPHLTPDHDLVSHLVYAARGSDVRHTVCDGQVLMRNRELTTLDEPAVRDEANTRARTLFE